MRGSPGWGSTLALMLVMSLWVGALGTRETPQGAGPHAEKHWHWPHRHHRHPPPPAPKPSPPAPRPPAPRPPSPPAPEHPRVGYMVGFKLELKLDLELERRNNDPAELDFDEFDTGLALFLNTTADEVRVNDTDLFQGSTAVSGAVMGYISRAQADAGLAKMAASGAAEDLEKKLLQAGLPLKSGAPLHVDFVDVEEYVLPAPGKGSGARRGHMRRRSSAVLAAVLSVAALVAVSLMAFRKRLLPLRSQPGEGWTEEEQPLLA